MTTDSRAICSRSQALTHGVSIELELPEDLELLDDPSWGDPELISSAVENLIRNAIHFSPRESAVHVSLSAPETVEPPRAPPRARKEFRPRLESKSVRTRT